MLDELLNMLGLLSIGAIFASPVALTYLSWKYVEGPKVFRLIFGLFFGLFLSLIFWSVFVNIATRPGMAPDF